MEVIPGVYQIQTTASNMYLILENDELTLVDGGTKGALKPLLRQIGKLGVPIGSLKRILLTHSDVDHVGVVRALKEMICPEVYASRPAAEALAEGRVSRPLQIWGLRGVSRWLQPRLSRTMHIQVDRVLSPGDTLPLLGGLEVIGAPGHTPGQVVFYAREKSLLFSGDAFRTRVEEIKYNLIPAFTWDADQVKATHKMLAALKPQVVCGGHGPVVFEAAGKFVL
jgi:glyoxylase-like metal-dependent hydrolase (beta-lactamase superfamily II)